MNDFIVDHQYGGFMCNADRKGNKITTNKRAWFDGRGIWVYSYLYNNLDQNPGYLETALKTVQFVLKLRPGRDEFWPWSYTRKGEVLNEVVPDIYGNLFIAEGLAEYSKASGERKYWDTAKEIVLDCMQLYDKDDYAYNINYGPPGAENIPAPRVLGHWMIFLNAARGMLNIQPDGDLESISERCIDALMNRHYVKDFNLMIEILAHDCTIPHGPYSRFVYTGHAIEVLWMIMAEAQRKGDKAMFDLAASRFRRHAEVAWDDVYGGIFRCLEDVDKNIWQIDKVQWAQAEFLTGLMLLIEHCGDSWAYRWFEKAYNYVIENYPLKKYGYSLWNIDGDRKMTFRKEAVRVENYHHPRHLMLNILSLERMINSNKSRNDV